MVRKLIGRKLGMMRYFGEEARSVPVSVLEVGPCVVVQKKTVAKEGYNALQVGFGPQREKRVNKPMRGHFAKTGKGFFSHLKEIRVDNPDEFEIGQEITSDIFQPGERVNISGASKGRGFAGVIKRWGFSGGKKTHGCRSHRVPGSIGCSATPGKVMKGRKLPGRMGSQRVTVKNLKVVDVRADENIVLVRGAVPGASQGILEISKA